MAAKEQIREAAENLEHRRQAAAATIEDMSAVIARYRAYRTHEFDDETGYCTACGQQDTYAIANAIQCFGAPNITAISHLRRPMLDADFEWNIPA